MIFGFVGGFFPQKNYLLLMLEMINVYEVVVFMYILWHVWIFGESGMLSRKVNGKKVCITKTFTDPDDS